MLAQASLCASIRLEGKTPAIIMDYAALEGDAKPKPYNPKSIDPVLMEIFATAYFLDISPDILNLERIIREEVSLH